ncbi:piggyBac transposable element-derived protein 4 [Trichonephila inaurata madagascariensis]|uniref:PiggyBac transposable element-derived protein 4 n=1 Tax=Trichonephila inaurata madagascariensis TaxID=2747483 RepID=A0A8X6WXC8_9ARAC|nr:piggyBac transposable element-derived protein 4 [Trichonephila inaurata madagascariensis]
MPRKGLTIPEALEVFHNLPSDFESDESSLSEAEDVITAKSSSSENTDIDEEKDDISVPGLSRISKVTWKNKASVKIRNIPFTEQSGPSDEITSLQDPSPISIFFTLFSISFIEKIVYQTNLYATQKGNAFTSVTVLDILCFLAINIVMGIKRLPSYRDFWSTNEILHDAFVSRLMPVRKFIWILGNIHLNDNNLMPKKSEKNFDKLYKVRPLLDHLSEMFLKVFKPGQK